MLKVFCLFILTAAFLGSTGAIAQDRVVVVPLGGGSTASSGIFTVQPAALIPLQSSYDYYNQGDSSVVGDSNLYLYCTLNDTGTVFKAPVYLPDGVTITRFELHARDTSDTTKIQAALGQVCQTPTGSSSPVYTALSDAIGTTNPYNAGNVNPFDNTIGVVVDNQNCFYHVSVSLSDSLCAGPDIQFYKARVFWER
jgi:hypothetical protein